MKLSTATLLFIVLLITIAVLGHSVWHTQVLSVMHALTRIFTGTT
jgi:hypothetical protein